MGEPFIERIERWEHEAKRELRKHWWGLAMLILIGLVEHRIFEATNRFIDNHAHLSELKPILSVLASSAIIQPFLLALTLFLLGLFALLAHAYWTTRSGDTIPQELPEHRPRVLPVAYGEESGAWGLTVANPGYDATDVHIPPVVIAWSGYTLLFPERVSLLTERDHHRFIAARLVHPTLPRLDGEQLFAVMESANIDSLKFFIHYKDADSLEYTSNCEIERDASTPGGIAVKFLNQELADGNAVPDKPKRTSAEQYHYEVARVALERIGQEAVIALRHLKLQGTLTFGFYPPPLPIGMTNDRALGIYNECLTGGLVTRRGTSEFIFEIAGPMQSVLGELLYESDATSSPD